MPPRFFIDRRLPRAGGESLLLEGSVARHIHVLRLTAGDAIVLFDGEGGECAADIVHIDKRAVAARIGSWQPAERESPLDITIAQALVGSEKMEWLIQKTTELGVRRIAPIVSARSVARLDEARADKRLRHWQAVAIAACEQCGRNRIPAIDAPRALPDCLGVAFAAHAKAILTPAATQPLTAWARQRPPAPLLLLIGPEGGFDETEIDEAVRHGAAPVHLGARVLRTETAGIAALAALQAVCGELA